jgi:phospholipid transport system substrate-binding protein
MYTVLRKIMFNVIAFANVRNSFVKNLSLFFVFYLSVISSGFSASEQTVASSETINTYASPYVLLERVGNKLFNQIAQLTPEQRQNSKQLRTIVETQLMPSIDHRYAAYKIMGKYVRSASPEQRKAFVQAMRHYLINTYASALTQYKNQQVVFEQDKATNGKRIVSVKAQIVADQASSSPTIDIDFRLRQNKQTKEWQAFDMIVEGISLLSSKQAEINAQIRKIGLDATIALLNEQS